MRLPFRTAKIERLDRYLAKGQFEMALEAISNELQDRYFERMGAELHNLYGPTEAAVDVTHWACEPVLAHWGSAAFYVRRSVNHRG